MRQLSLHVTVAYGTDLAEAQRLAHDVLRQNPRVLAQPTPVVGLARLGESGVEMLAQPWVRVPDYVPAQAELYQALVERLRVSGITIPFPQQEVRLLTAA
jgi:small conductance mechanosensitive channel